METVFVCKREELKDGSTRIVNIGELEIGIVRHAGQFYAYRNYCPHQGGPACEGVKMPQVVDEIGPDGIYLGQSYDESDMHIVCPWHGYEFHLSDGTHVSDKRLRLQKFQIVEKNGEVYVQV